MKIVCEQCKKEGYLQVLGSYYRIRHYSGINDKTKKSMFYYHQQSKGYIQSLLREQKLGLGPEPNGKQCSSGQESIDPNLLNPSSLNEKNTRAGSSVRIEHQSLLLVFFLRFLVGCPLDLWFYPVGLVLLFFLSFFHLLIGFVWFWFTVSFPICMWVPLSVL